jgi:hypothetical protein
VFLIGCRPPLITRQYIPEDSELHTRRRENLNLTNHSLIIFHPTLNHRYLRDYYQTLKYICFEKIVNDHFYFSESHGGQTFSTLFQGFCYLY